MDGSFGWMCFYSMFFSRKIYVFDSQLIIFSISRKVLMVVASELRRLYFFSDFPQWDMKAYRETIRRVWSSRSVDEQIFRFLHFYDHNLATFLFFRIRRKKQFRWTIIYKSCCNYLSSNGEIFGPLRISLEFPKKFLGLRKNWFQANCKS